MKRKHVDVVLKRFRHDSTFRLDPLKSNTENGDAFEDHLSNYIVAALSAEKITFDNLPKELYDWFEKIYHNDKLSTYSIPDYYRPVFRGRVLVISQPFGRNRHPDILVFQNYQVIPIECKTTKTVRPNFNKTVPKKGTRFVMYIAGLDHEVLIIDGSKINHPMKIPEIAKKVEEKHSLAIQINKMLKDYVFRIGDYEVSWYCRMNADFVPRIKKN